MKKIISFLIAAVLSVSVVATAVGCGGPKGNVEEGATVIQMYAMNFEEYQTSWYEQVKDEFNSILDDGWQLDVKYFDKPSYSGAFQAAKENGTAPDIFWTSPGNTYNSVIKMNTAEPLDDLMGEEYINDLQDWVKPSITFGGKVMCWPLYREPSTMLFYSKSLFEQAGITKVPTTWTELLDACAKLKSIVSKGQFVLGIPTQTAIAWSTVGLQVNTTGGRAVDDSWTQCRVNENEAGWQALVGLFYDIQAGGYAPGAALTDEYDNIVTMLCEGALAMTMGMSTGLATAYRTYPEDADDIGYAIMPTWEDGLGQNATTASNGGWSLCISNTSSDIKKQGAAEVIKFFTNKSAERGASFFETSVYSRAIPFKSVQEYVDNDTDIPEALKERQALVSKVSSTACAEADYAWAITNEVGQMFAKMYQVDHATANRQQTIVDTIKSCRQTIEGIITASTYEPNPNYKG